MAINTGIIKSYAPQARLDFIEAVKARAARFGITEAGFSDIQVQGDVAIINGHAYPRAVARQRKNLEAKILAHGFMPVVEEVAYTWFNRFAAIRYMELHGYLEHGFRVLSHPRGGTAPEILQNAETIDLPGLSKDKVMDLKLDGSKDEELYRMLLVAQCNALHTAMPFLFERIEDETELLLPDNLLHSDSVVRQLVNRIPEKDWQAIEIIGWMYQFYISEKKDQVIGKVVKSEDIPAATQLFTPNWIVKYMVQNSLGAKWLLTYPDSPIRAKMEYYIEPADHGTRQNEASTSENLDPEKLTFLDPASGSGHILVEAYDLFKELYLEHGYRLRDIPRLILEKNLFGLDIDDRAAQLSGFALMMRARADDRRILSAENPVLLNILSIQESKGSNLAEIIEALLLENTRFELLHADDLMPETLSQPLLSSSEPFENDRQAIVNLMSIFADAKTYGSLISIPHSLFQALPSLKNRLQRTATADLALQAGRSHAEEVLLPLIEQADLLGRQYDVVAANPPYMGGRGMNELVTSFLAKHFVAGKGDLMTAFIMRSIALLKPSGLLASVTLDAWMFISTYKHFRPWLLAETSVASLIHIGWNAFPTGHVYNRGVAFVLDRSRQTDSGTYIDLSDVPATVDKNKYLLGRHIKIPVRYQRSSQEFQKIPTTPIAYSISDELLIAFASGESIGKYLFSDGLTKTGKNAKYLRYHWEVDNRSATDPDVYRTCVKGGESRSYYGNTNVVVDWSKAARTHYRTDFVARISPEYLWERSGISWTKVSSKGPTFRWFGDGMIAETGGPAIFLKDGVDESILWSALGYLNSNVSIGVLSKLSPTINVQTNDILALPFDPKSLEGADVITQKIVLETKLDWNEQETAIDFTTPAILRALNSNLLSDCYIEARQLWRERVERVRLLQEDNKRIFAEALGISAGVEDLSGGDEVTLSCNPHHRYGQAKSEIELERLLLADSVQDFLSYAVGCIVGRFSIDKPGVILASQGETIETFLEHVPRPTFMPDADNVVPILDDNWFPDDVTDRFLEFLAVTFGREQFEKNLSFVETAIGKDVRKYFMREFFLDHLRRYRRRPIYWLFSSGKEKAFEALVYMHRYNEGTLARMRMNYVVPLQSQIANRIERLAFELNGGNYSSAERKRKDTQRTKLIKQHEELRRFEEELRHYADKRVGIDLNDGVKVNYGKFGNLVAEVPSVTGESDD